MIAVFNITFLASESYKIVELQDQIESKEGFSISLPSNLLNIHGNIGMDIERKKNGW